MDKFFKISEHGSSVKTEIIAGFTTFFAMAYIVFVNPNQVTGFTPGLDNIWNAVYVASILAATIGTLLMALYAKKPFAQACGMGLNSFFFVSFVLPQVISGGDAVQGYQAGLVIILISGIIFMILSVTGARQYIAKAMPECLKKAIPAGIGLFITYIGFQNVGIIQDNQYTLTQFVDIHGAINGDGIMTVVPALLALVGFLIIVIFQKLNVKGNVIIGIIATTVLYYIVTGTTPSFDMAQIGQSFKDFTEVGIAGVFKGSSWEHAFSPAFVGGVFSAIMYIITFCLVDMFDTIGTLIGVSSKAGMLDENGKLPKIKGALLADAVATMTGAVLGTTTTTTFVESASGVSEGGRTGLTAVTTAILFGLALFLSPIFLAIPSFATAPALVVVGFYMLTNVVNIDFKDIAEALPCYICIGAMPFFYSISEGISMGVISYVALNLLTGRYKEKKISMLMYVLAVLFICKYAFL